MLSSLTAALKAIVTLVSSSSALLELYTLSYFLIELLVILARRLFILALTLVAVSLIVLRGNIASPFII